MISYIWSTELWPIFKFGFFVVQVDSGLLNDGFLYLKHRALADLQILVFVINADSGLLNDDFLYVKHRNLADFQICVFVVEAGSGLLNDDFYSWTTELWPIFKVVFLA